MEMTNRRNYQKELDKIIEGIEEKKTCPSLLLHSCCAPCSSYVLEYLSKYFRITIFYYNPNIYPDEEFEKRAEEQKKFVEQFPATNPIKVIIGEYDKTRFYEVTKGLEHEKEGGERCFACYRLRLEETAKLAKELGFEYFTTTLSISPLKKSEKLNEIGEEIGRIYNLKHLPSDFKKRGGYLRSTEISKEYGMYRQNYCGCIFSVRSNREQ